MTIDGPAFVDAEGMTLYTMNAVGANRSVECDDRRNAVLLQSTFEGKVDFSTTAPDLETRRTCLQKRPPLLAPADAQPIGKWSLHAREDGSRQWAYDGKPLHTSIKDKAPGEINGAYPYDSRSDNRERPWTIALAPMSLVGAPSGIIAKKTSMGLALASAGGKTLYYPDGNQARPRSRRLWEPLAAPFVATAQQLPDWSIVTHGNGSQQWTYQGRPLHTYVEDSRPAVDGVDTFADIFGRTYGQRMEGWHVALLKEGPTHPPGVTIQTIVISYALVGDRMLQKRIYANAEGMTLYTFQCVEDTADRLDCDDVGDSPRYWIYFCGGADRCARTWRPMEAPAGAKSINNMWSVITLNPRHPWQALDKGTVGLRVWAYRGRPLFTYAHDFKPGDANGATDYHPARLRYMETISAFGTVDS